MRRAAWVLLVLASCGQDAAPPPPPAPPPAPAGPAKFADIVGAQKFAAKDYLYPDKVTILEFFMEGDPGCAAMAPKLKALAGRYEKAVLRRVDIANYESLAAQQAKDQFQMSSLPFQVVLDGKGNVVAKLTKATIDEVEAAVRQAVAR
jgi:thiol-disulfide isomerase/thioredoxin